jgi:hypothetical protein
LFTSLPSSTLSFAYANRTNCWGLWQVIRVKVAAITFATFSICGGSNTKLGGDWISHVFEWEPIWNCICWRCWHLWWNLGASTISWSSSSPKTIPTFALSSFSFTWWIVNGHSRNHGQFCKVAFFHVLNCAWVKMHNSPLEVQTESTKQDPSLLSNSSWGALSWCTLRHQYKYTKLYSYFKC